MRQQASVPPAVVRQLNRLQRRNIGLTHETPGYAVMEESKAGSRFGLTAGGLEYNSLVI
jgi:hypothetical protein